jgi:hypothetical protein
MVASSQQYTVESFSSRGIAAASGNANLLIGEWQNANREIGVPGKHTIPLEMWINSGLSTLNSS